MKLNTEIGQRLINGLTNHSIKVENLPNLKKIIARGTQLGRIHYEKNPQGRSEIQCIKSSISGEMLEAAGYLFIQEAGIEVFHNDETDSHEYYFDLLTHDARIEVKPISCSYGISWKKETHILNSINNYKDYEFMLLMTKKDKTIYTRWLLDNQVWNPNLYPPMFEDSHYQGIFIKHGHAESRGYVKKLYDF